MKFLICQSCGLPFTISMSGYLRDGTRSEEYCEKCLKEGEFVEHSLSMHQLEVRLIKNTKIKNGITLQEAQMVLRVLPDLKRWKLHNL